MKTKRFLKILICAVILSVVPLSFAGCGDEDNGAGGAAPKVEVEMENGGKFTIELYPQYAPLTVENFIGLVESGFYDGLIFHRIMDGFMAQGGGFTPDGEKKDARQIFGEFASNGFEQNTLNHTAGVISMARTDVPDSASSEFFIMFADNAFLDGEYAAFGKVTEGFETIAALQEVERTYNQSGELASPIEPVIIKSMTVMEK